MKKDITVSKFGLTLRPVTIDDARFIIELRTHPELSKYIGDTVFDEELQKQWIEAQQKRENDYYFCIELENGRKVGTIAIYNIKEGKAEWGRWIISPEILAGPASAWLIYYIAFYELELSEVYCQTVENNKKVLSFHDNSGAKRVGFALDGVMINGEKNNLVLHSVIKEDWPELDKNLFKMAKYSQRFLEEEN